MRIAVHSPWLLGYTDVVQTVLIILTMAALFPDRPCIYHSASIVVSKLLPRAQSSQPPLFVKLVLLEHSHIRSGVYVLPGAALVPQRRVSGCDTDHRAREPGVLADRLLTGRVCQVLTRTSAFLLPTFSFATPDFQH